MIYTDAYYDNIVVITRYCYLFVYVFELLA